MAGSLGNMHSMRTSSRVTYRGAPNWVRVEKKDSSPCAPRNRVASVGMAYADAGASGLFVPGLADEALVARVCGASPLPVNVMVASPAPDLARLAVLGVARVSFGPVPYLAAMAALREAARALYQPG